MLVLGLGVAVNTSVFTVVNAYLLRPLPYPAAERVVTIRSPVAVLGPDVDGLFEAQVTWDLDAFTLLGDEGPELARGAWVTTDFLEVYGVQPALGRMFLPEEGGPGATESVVILSYRLWQSRYGGSPDVLGRTLRAYTSDRPDDAEVFTIVGVLPRDFWHFNDYTDVLAPLREVRAVYAGRLVPEVTPRGASDALTQRVAARSISLPEGFRIRVLKAHDLHVASVRPTLWTLQAAALLVFLIACANAAVLLLVRSVRRERELGVRRALGAAGGRLDAAAHARGHAPRGWGRGPGRPSGPVSDRLHPRRSGIGPLARRAGRCRRPAPRCHSRRGCSRAVRGDRRSLRPGPRLSRSRAGADASRRRWPMWGVGAPTHVGGGVPARVSSVWRSDCPWPFSRARA